MSKWDAKVKNVALKTKSDDLTLKNDRNHLKRKLLSFLTALKTEIFTSVKALIVEQTPFYNI
jgi:hypothetical protein